VNNARAYVVSLAVNAVIMAATEPTKTSMQFSNPVESQLLLVLYIFAMIQFLASANFPWKETLKLTVELPQETDAAVAGDDTPLRE